MSARTLGNLLEHSRLVKLYLLKFCSRLALLKQRLATSSRFLHVCQEAKLNTGNDPTAASAGVPRKHASQSVVNSFIIVFDAVHLTHAVYKRYILVFK